MWSRRLNVAIVEDDSFYRIVMEKHLRNLCNKKNYPWLDLEVNTFSTAKEFLNAKLKNLDILILDYYLESKDDETAWTAMDIVEGIRLNYPKTKIIILSAQRNVEVTAELFRKGITEYVAKDDFSVPRTVGLIQTMLKNEYA
jgi:response regulator of citrate/malate metabolism